MTYRVAVLGAGKIAAAHINAVKELAGKLEAVAAADALPERANAFAEKYNMKGYTDYKQMIRTEKPDIAVIALPPYLHKEAAVYCAEQGCHVMLEKPMALTRHECSLIIDAAKKSNIKLMVTHSIHYSTAERKVKQLIEQGYYGELVMMIDVRHVDYFVDNRLPWSFEKDKAGGGVLYNLGAHSIDKIQWMTGSPIKKVRSSISYKPPRRGDIEGAGVVFLETESGIPATISQSAYKGAAKNETEFVFTKGMIKMDWEVYVSKNNKYEKIEIGPQQSAQTLQFIDFMDSIENNTELECSGEYGKSIVEVIDAIYASNASGTEITINR